MATKNRPTYLQQEEAASQECKELMSTLPKQNGWFDSSYLYQYQGFWYQPRHLQGVITCQKHFQAQDSDVFLVPFPKCGTTWLRAIIFTLLYRKTYPVDSENHPLRTTNPHDLGLGLEINPNATNPVPSSRRFFTTHLPYTSLPESVKNSPNVKVVYVCRNPKDTFVSLWHFVNKLRESGESEIGEMFDMFCKGVVYYGPFWEHVLGYWKRSRESQERVLFVKYEDVKEEGAVEVRRMAEFLECGFSEEEEEEDVVEKIVELCSFESMTSMEVNRSGRIWNGTENRHFFREGVVGGWRKYLSSEMGERLDGIMDEKLFGSGLVL